MTIDEFMDAVREARKKLARLEESLKQLDAGVPISYVYLDECMTKRVRAAAKECVEDGIYCLKQTLDNLEDNLNYEG